MTQSILGRFVFVVFVFAQPAARAANLETPMLPGMTINSSRAVINMGILTSSHFCLAIQGGQFLFMARLISAADSVDFLKQKSGNTMRAMFWNANMAFAGLWTLITGAIVGSQVDSSKDSCTFYVTSKCR